VVSFPPVSPPRPSVHNYRICIVVNREPDGVTSQDSNLRSHSDQELLYKQPSFRSPPHVLLFSFPHSHVTDQCLRAGIAQSVHRLATDWSVRGSIPVEGARISTPVQTGPGAHPASYTMDTGPSPGVKRPGRGVEYPPPSGAEVKKA